MRCVKRQKRPKAPAGWQVQPVLTGGETRVRVGSIPAGGRGAAPHTVLVGRQLAHVAQVAVAVASHGRV